MNLYPEDEREPDPPEFDRSKVPDGPVGDLLIDGRSGRGLTDAEYDEQLARFHEHGEDPFHPDWTPEEAS
jgi:hypothetical protein